MQEAREIISNYFAQLDGPGDPDTDLSERRKSKEAIIRNFGCRFKTIVYNNLNPQGSSHLKLREYLSMELSAFLEGVIFEHSVRKVFPLHISDETDSFYYSLMACVKLYCPEQAILPSDGLLLFNVSFIQ